MAQPDELQAGEVIPLSTDERRIITFLQRRAETYREAAMKNPFSFHNVRAKLCEALAGAIDAGKHR